MSTQEATVRAIREAASRRLHREKIAALSMTARDRYADLLDRLGTLIEYLTLEDALL